MSGEGKLLFFIYIYTYINIKIINNYEGNETKTSSIFMDS
jgi:hypothetical protein